ncbi:hypothetical protein RMCBS344292_07243 [Rhizopus microsporus]|nr:hypothetical protein RMCBS344292_07243 [Rhizopus microsporus]
MFFESTFVPSPPLSDTQADNLSADEEDHSQIDIDHHSDKPVDHVIFGIGQQTEQYGQFYEHIEDLQETTRQTYP